MNKNQIKIGLFSFLTGAVFGVLGFESEGVQTYMANELDRNFSAVHEAAQAYVDGVWSMVADKGLVNWGNTYLPMWDFDKWGLDDCRDWMQRGIDWWRKEIESIATKAIEAQGEEK